jgi:DNA mismatch repair protein MutS2
MLKIRPTMEAAADSRDIDELEAHAQSALEWLTLLARLSERAQSELGKARLLALSPAATLAEARERTARVRAALRLAEHGVALPNLDFPDIEETLGRIGLHAATSGSELIAVARVLGHARALREVVTAHGESAPELVAALSSEPKLDRLHERLLAALESNGTVSDAASPELRHARQRAREVREELKRRLNELVQRYGDVIQGAYYTERDGRYVLPVRADAHYRVEGIVLGSSSSGSTLFVEPQEVTNLGNKLRVREAEVEREIARVLAELVLAVAERLDSVRVALEACIVADVLAALTRFAGESRARPVDVAADDRIELFHARHPLLALSGVEVVANDITLRGGEALVISGPNAGGKTVALKCLGLFAWMVRAGVPIPANAESHVGWFEHVLADIGDEQSLVRSLSTFSAHVENLARILSQARPGVLVLLDEVAAGTDPEEGAALAAAILETLASRGAAVAVTTHYERLKELAAKPGALANASVGFDFVSMSPTFRLTLGVPGASSALLVAARHGLSAELLARAHEHLPRAALERERVIRELGREHERLNEERQELAEQARKQGEYAEQLRAERDEEHARARANIETETHALLKELRASRSELVEARARLKAMRASAMELRQAETSASRAAHSVTAANEFLRPPPLAAQIGRVLDAKELLPGARVIVRANGAVATVLERPSRGEVSLRLGALRIRERLDALDPAPPSAKPITPAKPRRAPTASSTRAAAQRTRDNTLDIRGLRVEDAPNRLDAFLDRMLGEGEPVGFVLHGHGTGALRSRVREHLAGCSYVEHVRAAEPDEGGDAFTVFWVR